MQASMTLEMAPPRSRPGSAQRIGAWGALARGGFNIAQFVYVMLYMQVITEADDYDPAVLKAHAPFLHIDAVIMIGMGLGWIVAVWALYDLMRAHAPMLMRLSLVTAIIGGGALFVLAGQTVARFNALFHTEDYSPELQGFALHLLDVQSLVFGHVMATTGAISTLLWGIAAWRAGMLTKPLAIAGIVGGVVATLFVFTPLSLLGFLFQTPIFIWLGVSLWRASSPVAQPAGSLEMAE